MIEATKLYGEKVWGKYPSNKDLASFYQDFYDGLTDKDINFYNNFYDGLSDEELKTELEMAKITEQKLQDNVDPEVLCAMGGVLMEPQNPCYNQCLATVLFHIAHEKKCIEGTFWYGHALLCRLGIEKADDILARKLIGKAASHGVRHALFELGMAYEHGSYAYLKNLPFALVYYEAVTTRPRPPSGHHELLDNFEQIQPLRNPDWHEIDKVVGENIFSMMAWVLAGQAFLFTAAATLAIADVSEHYGLLFFFLPIIGIFVSFTSILTTFEVMARNGGREQTLLLKVWVAKKKACEALVGESLYGKANLLQASCLSWFSGWCCLILNVLFLVTWIILLVTESMWWCASDVRLFQMENKSETQSIGLTVNRTVNIIICYIHKHDQA